MDGEWLDGWMESLRKKEQYKAKEIHNKAEVQFTSATADNVPMDWVVGRTEDGGQKIVGPDGSRHKNRREALKHMVSKAFSEEEIGLMRSCLKSEGWEHHEKLPANWKFKTKTDIHGTRIYIMTACGKMFDTAASAVRYMQNSLKFRSSEIERVHSLANMEKAVRPGRPTPGPEQPKINWTEDGTVPTGWKVGLPEGGKQRILCPDGTQHGSRREGLKYMVQKGFPDEYVTQMRSFLKVEGWKDDDRLPLNWKMKIKLKKHNMYPRKLVMSSNGIILDTFAGAVRFMEKSKKYDQEAIDKVKSMVPSKMLNTNKTSQKIPNKSTRITPEDFSWISGSPTVPKGWKLALDPTNPTLVQQRVLSPDGRHFRSRRTALEHMLAASFTEEQVEEMREGLQFEGWHGNENLPPKWKLKIKPSLYKPKYPRNVILSETGRMFDGIKHAILYMKSSKEFSSEDVVKVKKLHKIRNNRIRENSDTSKPTNKLKRNDDNQAWVLDETSLPPGWQVAADPKVAGKQIIRSPTGQQFGSRASALRHMVRNGFCKEEVEQMRLGLRKEGWEVHPKLPKGWRLRAKRSGDKIKRQVMTPRGTCFESPKRAVDFMQKFGYFECDVELLQGILYSPKKSGPKRWYGWKSHPNLPRNWTMKLKTDPTFRLLLQAEGKDEMDLAAAASVMNLSPEYSKEDVAALIELEKEIRKTYSLQIDMEEENEPKHLLDKTEIKDKQQEDDDEDEDEFDYVDDTDYGYEEEKQDDLVIKDSSIILDSNFVQKVNLEDSFKKESINMFNNIDDMDTFDDLLSKNIG